eukprot:gnl/TRDRNA2_/TRDRNA2_205014_c0_seq1.p1 gnl/TRDRNA2_/TRDRNA2_205014_c0~~gnl/TRDRNA2_/TRDRNA2_205014_c0_seq1.p1  ORF type:complete len:442 (-),score=67.05 gnl/TRDRNA2_/TRDRNA2_205014_c0_seq1:35-1312(-)
MGNKRHTLMVAPDPEATRGSRRDQSRIRLSQQSRKLEEGSMEGRRSTTGRAVIRPQTWREFLGQDLAALKALLLHWMNVLLIFVPVGLYVRAAGFNSAVIFGTNFLAIIPLASVLGAATEALAGHTGQLIGGLLNATFGNAVEMIMCVQAVRSGLIRVVQGNLLGSILSNLLLVLGMAIFASGVLRKEQAFNAKGASANMTCQIMGSISISLPTMYHTVSGTSDAQVLMLSRCASLVTMMVYFMFLLFQLKTHADLFVDEGGDEEEEDGEAQLSVYSSIGLLFGATLVVAASSECLVDSIEDVSETFGLPKAFIGVILLPIVGNAAEHATAVGSAIKGMMDLALGVAVGSSTQIALFVVPFTVIMGWIVDSPMGLNFRDFDATCQMLSVFLVSQVLSHGTTNWLHGAMLMTTYLLIAIICWFIPE